MADLCLWDYGGEVIARPSLSSSPLVGRQPVGSGAGGCRRATGERIIVIRQRLAERAEAGGKTLFDLPAYRFEALITNLPASKFDTLAV